MFIVLDAIALSCLPFGMEDEDFAGEFTTVTGWGQTADDAGAAIVLNYANDVPVITNEECQDEFDNNLGTLTLEVSKQFFFCLTNPFLLPLWPKLY